MGSRKNEDYPWTGRVSIEQCDISRTFELILFLLLQTITRIESRD